MLLSRSAVSMGDIVVLVQQWRVENPTVRERISRSITEAFERMRESLSDLGDAIAGAMSAAGPSTGSVSAGSGSDHDSTRSEHESSGYEPHERIAPTIDLSPPDFGPGSTLGH